ncbi:MAG: helicase HerA domain-containing protein [Candidatus Heimdallarchaeaceae archaeon]
MWFNEKDFFFILFFILISSIIVKAQNLKWVNGRLLLIIGTLPCSFYTNRIECEAAGCCWCTSDGAYNCQICPCPTPTPPPSPGGPGGAFISPEEEKKEENITVVPPLSLSTNTIEVRLYPGEYQIVSLGITNNQENETTIKLSVEGDIWPFTLFEKDKFDVKPGETYHANIKFYTLPTTLPGVYNGNIVVKSGNITKKVTVILRVEYKAEKLLDIKVDPITKDVYPGDRFKYLVTLYNLGLTKRVDVFINYTIRSVENDTIIAKTGETVALETSLSFDRSIKIPNTTTPGVYVIEAIAAYEDKRASAVASFNVVKPFWLIPLLWSIFTNWMTYVILFVLIPSLYLIKKLYEKMRLKKVYRARYVRPVDLKKLPKKGLYVGKIAETKVNAYIDPDDLTTHLIVAGGTGSGKSVASMVIAEELLKRGVPVIVFDPTAQWTGFIRPCTDSKMLKLYRKFGIRKEEARAFKGTIIQVTDPFMKVEIEKFIKKGEITVFVLNKLTPEQLDYFVRKTIDYMFTISWPESRKLKLLMVYDEVHRLLPKYARRKVSALEGGGYLALERAVREFRKWGIGLIMISQVLLDFKGAIRAVIATEAQMRTKYAGDINRIKTKYGWQYAASIPKLEVGTGLVQNPAYNNGKPWFITFRPLLHDTFRISDEELEKYEKFKKEIEDLRKKIEALKKKKIDTYDMELEINLAEEKTKVGQLRMAETYIESVKSRLETIKRKKK